MVAEEGLEPNAVQGRAALFEVYSVREFAQCPLQHQKIHRRLSLLDIFCVAAAANRLAASPAGCARRRDRLFALRAHNPSAGGSSPILPQNKEKPPIPEWVSEVFWLRRKDLNQRPSGYEPDELPTALLRDILYFLQHLKR